MHSPAVFEHLQNITSESVPVLLEKSNGVIKHITSIVLDSKLPVVDFWFDIEGVLMQTAMKLGE